MNAPKNSSATKLDVITHLSEQVKNIEGNYFHFPENSDSLEELKLLYGGIEKISAENDYIFGHAQHLGFEYIISGKCMLTYNDKTYELGPGSILALQPSDRYRYEIMGKAPLIRAYFGFSQDVGKVNEGLQQFLRTPNPFKLNNVKWMRQTLQQVVDCGCSDNEEGEQLCSLLIAYFIKRVNLEKTATPKTATHASATFDRVRSYIETNYLEIKRINEVSKSCYISLPHLSRLFKEFSIEKPSQMLNRLKLEKAAEMLMSGNHLIKEIADYIGYDDALYFSNRFKLYFGVSPKYYSESKVAEFPSDVRKAG